MQYVYWLVRLVSTAFIIQVPDWTSGQEDFGKVRARSQREKQRDLVPLLGPRYQPRGKGQGARCIRGWIGLVVPT